MMTDRSTLVTRYAIAFLFIGLAIGATFFARSLVDMPPSPLLLVGILGAAWFGGRIPGLIAVVVADLSFDLFFDGSFLEFENPAAHAIRLVVFGVIALITSSRSKTEEELSLRERQQAAVVKLGQEALSGVSLQDLLSRSAELVKETLNADQTAICEVAANSSKYRFVAGDGWKENVVGMELDISSGYTLAGRVLESESPLVVDDLDRTTHLRPSEVLQKHGVRSMVGVKISGDNEVFGMFGAFRNRAYAFSDDDANFLSSVANIIAETAARSRAEAETNEHRNWLHTTLSSIGDGVIATDSSGKVNFMNVVAERLTGWDQGSAGGRPLNEVFIIVNEETRQMVTNPVETVMATGNVVGLANHTVLISRSGEEFPISDSAAPIRSGSEIRGVVLVFSDVTERKRAESFREHRAREIAALYEFTHRLQQSGSMGEVYEAALDSITLSLDCDRSSVLLFDDDAVMQFAASRGLSEAYRQSAAGHSPWTFGEKNARPMGIESLDSSDIEEPLLSAIRDEGIAALAFIPLISDERLIGKLMVYYDTPHSFADAEFEIAMTVATQIAAGLEHKQAETRLLENEERLRLATQTGKVGVWDWDMRTGHIEWTDAVYEMHGLNKGEFDGKIDNFSQLIHPGDRAFVAERIKKALSGEIPYDIEFRIVRPDGSVGWLFTNARVLRNGETPTRMVGATTDISERKQADEATARLAAIVNSSHDAIIGKDLDGTVTSWNRGAESLFGFTAAEVIGKPITILIPEDRINEEPTILNQIRGGEAVNHFETVRRHKDGTLLDISLSISPIFDRNGTIIGASKIARDITERKAAETARRDTEIMQRLVEAQESERHRIARDLHDHLGQKMTALRFKIEAITDKCASDPLLAQAIMEIQNSALQIDRDIGFLSWELRPTELDHLGLEDALASFVREWSGQYGIAAKFHANLPETVNGSGRLSQVTETNLYRIVQEGLNNILKHANAENVNILLQHQKGQIVLVIEDDGAGMDRSSQSEGRVKPDGLGLIGMSERAALLRGTLEIESEPGEGTTILVRVPFTRPE